MGETACKVGVVVVIWSRDNELSFEEPWCGSAVVVGWDVRWKVRTRDTRLQRRCRI